MATDTGERSMKASNRREGAPVEISDNGVADFRVVRIGGMKICV
ncbi:hypothetical protein DESC_720328 [Desulfosarcina cetonica]|nr:hypothetical protein DESC_720328 [Desulfosarcina cetonica]